VSRMSIGSDTVPIQESFTLKEAVNPAHCVYSLSLRNIKPSDAGTYYCAVVTCREILFGHGINLATDG
ncbi:hypothetical protein M9458_016557, partial [Cirrhinus mrigala]